MYDVHSHSSKIMGLFEGVGKITNNIFFTLHSLPSFSPVKT